MKSIKEQEKIIQKTWFPEHRAFLKNEGGFEILSWKKPNTGIYAVNYIIDTNKLIVTGDIGNAIYQWNQQLDFVWLSDLDLGYFASKCIASEHGQNYMLWSPDYLMKRLNAYFNDSDSGHEMKLKWKEYSGEEALYDSQNNWYFWLSNHAHKVFGDDWRDLDLSGMTISIRCHSHLVGIKMAVKQLNLTTKKYNLSCEETNIVRIEHFCEGCGGRPKLMEGKVGWRVYCSWTPFCAHAPSCSLEVPHTKEYPNPNEAVAAWNRHEYDSDSLEKI